MSPTPTALVTSELTAPTKACAANRWFGFVPSTPVSPRWVSATMSTNRSSEARRCSIGGRAGGVDLDEEDPGERRRAPQRRR